MAVVLDVKGTKGSNAALVTSFNYTGLTIGAGLTNSAVVFGIILSGGATTPTAITATWNSVSCTNLGSQSTAAASTICVLFGLKAPTSGTQTLALNWTNTSAVIVTGISFSGVDQTTPFQNANGSQSASTASLAPSITTTSGNYTIGVGYGGSATSFVSSPGTDNQVFFDTTTFAGTSGASGGVTINSSTTASTTYTLTNSPADFAGVEGVDLKAASTTVNPFVSNRTELPPVDFTALRINETWIDQGLAILPTPRILTQTLRSSIRFYDLPPRDYTPKLLDYGFTDDTNTILPIPRVLTQTLRTQSTVSNPQQITWYRDWNQNLLVSTLGVVQRPFVQTDWPNPKYVTWYQSWTESFNLTNPFSQLDWPLSRTYKPLDQFWSQSLNIFFQSETFPFVQSDYPNPQRIIWYKDWSQNLLENTLAPAFQAPFNQFDWPLPRTYQPIDQTYYQSLINTTLTLVLMPFSSEWTIIPNVPGIDQTWIQKSIQFAPQIPFVQSDWPLPRTYPYTDQTWLQNLSEFLQSNTFPFSQKDYPNSPPVYWYKDYNQNLVIYIPVGIKPFNQSDWPLPKIPNPIDQYWYQALVLNLPEPPPPVQQDTGGRQVWLEELEDLTLATHKWHQRLIDSYTNKTGEEIRKIAQTLGSLGGKARAESLTPSQRINIATKAAQTRWQSPRR